MVLGMLRSLVQKNWKPTARFADARTARPQAEELETRTTPAVMSPLGQVANLLTAVGHDVTDVQSDVRAVTQSLANTTNPAVSSAVTAVNHDLSIVLNDLVGGVDATNDLSALLSAESQLSSALGNTVSKTIQHQVNDLGHDLTALRNDLNAIASKVQNSLTNIQSDLQALTSALSSVTINASVGADLSALNSSVSALVTASLSGQVSTTAINTVVTNLNTLATDLGGAAQGMIQQAINHVRSDLMQLSSQVSQITQTIQQDVSSLQSDVTTLANSIASLNANATVTADVNNLNAAVSAVVTASASGQIPASAITAVLNDVNTLTHDLGSSITPAIRKQISNVVHDLTGLSNDVNRFARQVEREVLNIAKQLEKISIAVTAQINQSATVTADLSALNAAVSAIASDIASGSVSVADINAAIAAEHQLSAALGSSGTPQIRQLLNRLERELTSLRDSVKQITGVVRSTLASLEHEALQLARSLASTANATVVADLKALNSALAIVATDAALGESAAADISVVVTDLNKLVTDVGSTVSPQTQSLLDTIRGNLATLQSALGALLTV